MTTTVRAALLGAIATAAFAAAAPASAAGIGACLITKTDTNPFFVKMKEGATAAATAHGISLQTFAGKIDGDVETQIAAVESCVAAGAKGILITPSDSRALAPAVTPSVAISVSQAGSTSVPRCTRCAGVPIRCATSTRRRLDALFGAPITIMRSQSSAIALTASCRFEVA